MNSTIPLSRLWPLLVLGLALAWTVWSHSQRDARLIAVSALPTWSVEAATPSADSATGYTGEVRPQLVPRGNPESMFWIRSTQEVLGAVPASETNPPPSEERVDSASAPDHVVSPLYRGWLKILVKVLGGDAAAVFAAARHSDPWLHLMLLILIFGWAWRSFGSFAAATAAILAATLFPWSVDFAPGAPHQLTLFVVLNVGGILLLLPDSDSAFRRPRAWVAAGVLHALAFWMAPAMAIALVLPVVAGIAWRTRTESVTATKITPWQGWAITVAILVVSVRFVFSDEYTNPTQALWAASSGEHHLTASGVWNAANWLALLQQTETRWAALALVLPFLAFAVITLVWQRCASALLPAIVILFGIALFRQSWWMLSQTVLLIGIVELAGRTTCQADSRRRAAVLLILVLSLAPGWLLSQPPRAHDVADNLDEAEVLATIERDLAHWLRQRGGETPPVVIAAPQLATSLAYYGGIRTVGPQDNAQALIRILSATSPAETIALLESREVSHLVLLSWDHSLEDYVRMGRKLAPEAPLPADTFLHAVNRWALPPWLQPVPYLMPKIGGLDHARVVVFERNEETSEAIALARLAEYFLEVGNAQGAVNLLDRLRAQANDPGVLPTIAQLQSATGDRPALTGTLNALQAAVAAREFDYQPWDRRVALALLLTQLQLMAPAKEQVQACLREMHADDLRRLSAGTLLRFVAMTRIHDEPIPDPQLSELASGLLPPEYRQRLER